MKKLLLCASIAAASIAASSPCYALFGDDEARTAIVELRQLLKSQQESQMRLFDQVNRLSREVKQLRGELDELKNSSGRQVQQLQALQAQKNATDEAAAAADAKKTAAQDREILAQQALAAAKGQFDNGKFDAAIKQYSDITKTYKGTKAYPEALYGLASSYYMKGKGALAVSTVKTMTTAYQKHALTPEALLLGGTAALDIGSKAEADAFFKQLRTNFPKSKAAKAIPKY